MKLLVVSQDKAFNKESANYKIIDFKGYEYYRDSSKISGTSKLVYTDTENDLKIKYFGNIVPVDSVKLPKAYLIPQEWHNLVDILKTHGIQVEYLKVDSIFEVTKYRFKNVKYANSSYEGRQRVDFEYDLIREKRNVPSGSF